MGAYALHHRPLLVAKMVLVMLGVTCTSCRHLRTQEQMKYSYLESGYIQIVIYMLVF